MTDEATKSEAATPKADLTPKAPAPDHGLDPRRVPGAPQAAAAEALGDPAAEEAPLPYVDMEMRKRVNKRKGRGLWCEMGQDFPGCLICIRPWSARAIQIFRETYEKQLRAKNPKLRKNDDLDAADAIELNRATANMSIVGMKGSFGEATFTGTEEDKAIRRFVAENFLVPFDPDDPETANLIDMDFLQLLMGLNEGLSKVPYQEIDRLGEDFVYGSTARLDYSDSNR